MERSFWSTIRGKLLSRTLLVALLPIVVIGGVAIASLRSLSGAADDSLASAQLALSDEVVGTRVAGVAEQIARELASILDERVADVQNWSTDVGFSTAARAATGRAIVMGLPDMEIDEIEARFAEEPRLGDVHVERDLLTAVGNTPSFKEILITDQHGFNVDYSRPTSDFVQSDEGWWIDAMENGIHISDPEFDASAGVFTVDISVRVEYNGLAYGVLKASLDMNVVQIIADRYASGADAFDVSVVDQTGRFLAETSTGHQPDHIMNLGFVATSPTVSTEFVREAFAPNASELHADGYSIGEQGVAGFANVGEQLATLRADTRSELTSFNWIIVVEQPAEVAFAALAPLEVLASEVASTSSRLTIVLIIVAVFGAMAAAATALIVGARITRPIARLRDAAVQAAEVTLPNVVAQIDRLEAGEELPELEPFILVTGDEVEDLAHSFNTVQQTAANLASDQARLRRTNVATTFVNLGRRNQNLLSRQLEHINSMEANETNSDTLQRLFQLDHLATRMRRNAESLLVLAGEEPPRRFRQPVSMHKLLQAAGGEIEDFARVELTSLDESSVEGSAASDIAHLLAELLENASNFSPPGSPIQVHGRRRADSYLLAIVDQGIGMEEDALDAANGRLADPVEFDRAPSAYLGHFVVGQLAKRHGIRVRVADSPYGGLAAQLLLPASILTDGATAESFVEPTQAEALPDFTAEMTEPSSTELSEVEQDQIAALELALLHEVPQPNHVQTNHVKVQSVPATAPSPDIAAPAPTSPVIDEPQPQPAPRDPAVEFAATDLAVETITAEAVSAAAPVEMTPSGFRRRVRGQEGAPQSMAKKERLTPTAPRRSPEQVQESLQQFRHGIESGRAQANANTRDDQSVFEGDNQ